MDAVALQRWITEALWLSLLLSLPTLAASLLVGLGIGIVQAATQLQEQTLSFVPKLVAVALTLALAGGWMGAELVRFTEAAWRSIPLLLP